MKKIILLFIGLFIFAGCGRSGSKELKIKLEADLYSDYIWEYTLSEEGIVKIVDDNDIKCDEEKKECPVELLYRITPLSSGKTSLKFRYINNYNVEQYYAVYDIEVSEDLKITESHLGTYFER